MTRTPVRVAVGLDPTIAAQHAARAAILGSDGRSYAGLEAEVARLAAGLDRLGVGRGSRVAIWTDKGTRYVVAILAALRSGAAYVPLDGEQPASRVSAILSDARPAVLITDRPRLAALDLPAASTPYVVLCDHDLADADARPVGNGLQLRGWNDVLADGGQPNEPAQPDDLAALLYTSGSTGAPKGVQISHRNLAVFVDWAAAELDVTHQDVFSNHASFNFDLSTFDLFVALRVGAALWIIDSETARDVSALAAGIRQHRVSVMYCVPSIYNLLVCADALSPATVQHLRYLLFAGEVYPTAQVARLARLLPPNTQLYNLYGPTETNVCTAYRVRPSDLQSDAPLPIGTALPGAGLRVGDVGEDGIGELIVSGDCVTPGYWLRPAESKRAGHHVGEHRTGDLVSYRDHALIYRGRKDRMVKLYGYRVELGEIETVLLRHPAVAEAAVIAVPTTNGLRLRAFICPPTGSAAPGLIEIKRHCAQHLPRYMVPHSATPVDVLPRSHNGKVDYRGLAGASCPTATTPAPSGTAQ